MIGKLAVFVCLAVVCVADSDHKLILRNVEMTPKGEAPNKPTFKEIIIGKLPGKDSKIVGGTVVNPAHSYPWQAALTIDNKYFCGGSLISDRWILTAAHCAAGSSIIKAVLGAQNINVNELTQQTYICTNIIVHENYHSLTLKNDIAVVQLPSRANLNQYVAVVGLPSRTDSDLPGGTVVTPTGWGKKSDSASGITDELRMVNVPVMSTAVCSLTWNVDDSQVCINSSGGKGTCNGDSGGPLNYKGTTRGITSYGAAAGCEAGYPDVFTDVQYFLGWIQRNTGIQT